MIKPLSDEAIRTITDKVEEDYECVEMTQAEWEVKCLSTIAQEAHDNALRQVFEWGLEICPHWSGESTREVGVMKRDCSLCWQELKREGGSVNEQN